MVIRMEYIIPTSSTETLKWWFFRRCHVKYKRIDTWMTHEWHLNYTWITLKWHLNDTWIILELYLNDTWTTLELHLNYTWITLKWHLNDTWMTLEWHLNDTWIILEWHLNNPWITLAWDHSNETIFWFWLTLVCQCLERDHFEILKYFPYSIFWIMNVFSETFICIRIKFLVDKDKHFIHHLCYMFPLVT